MQLRTKPNYETVALYLVPIAAMAKRVHSDCGIDNSDSSLESWICVPQVLDLISDVPNIGLKIPYLSKVEETLHLACNTSWIDRDLSRRHWH
jgi:hypothetical protein